MLFLRRDWSVVLLAQSQPPYLPTVRTTITNVIYITFNNSNNIWGLIEGLVLIFKTKLIKIQRDILDIASSQRSQIPVFRLTYKFLLPQISIS
ncbi:hypothetical protein DQ015_05105 [Salmonella enterica subsp. enterica]|nr:hypothetical protein [Salmonella enterica subsp. enterica serovar Stanleyville]ECA7916639.1 hypothetical protein [Salmonella enterica subsp. enterica serovar Chichester]MLP10272.1 hypothetical protein [Salmonella enterica subsp. enterica serovar Stanleyville]